MKKYLLTAALVLIAANSFAVIKNSKHDMSTTGASSLYGRATVDQICVYCHAPHNAKVSALLWNRNDTAGTITMYNKTVSGTLNYTATNAPIQSASKTCLGCHDGTIAVDEYASFTGTAGKKISNSKMLGTDLRLSHPIGFTYDAALATADGELASPSGGQVGVGPKFQLFGASSDQMECATCHDVHNKYGQAGLLVMNNSASALCLNCHVK